MKRYLCAPIITFFLFLSFDTVYAQSDSIQDNSYYFDDGGISDAKNVIKLNILSTINGDLSLFYERVLFNSFSIEFGAGLILPYYITELPKLFSDEAEIKKPDSGYSLWIHPKYYFQQKAPELYFIGIQIRRRNYNQDYQTIVYTDITLNYGLQLILAKRIAFEYNIGIGYRFSDETASSQKTGINELIIPIGIKFGIII